MGMNSVHRMNMIGMENCGLAIKDVMSRICSYISDITKFITSLSETFTFIAGLHCRDSSRRKIDRAPL